MSYKINDNIAIDSDNNIFFHGIGYISKTVNKDGFSVSTEGSFIKPVAYEVNISEVMNYLTELSSRIDKNSFKVSVANLK